VNSTGAPRKVRKPELQGVRLWHVRGFESYLIFYMPCKGRVRPRFWRSARLFRDAWQLGSACVKGQLIPILSDQPDFAELLFPPSQ
jgi:hypothetical protein